MLIQLKYLSDPYSYKILTQIILIVHLFQTTNNDKFSLLTIMALCGVYANATYLAQKLGQYKVDFIIIYNSHPILLLNFYVLITRLYSK